MGSEKAPIYDVDYAKKSAEQYATGLSRKMVMKSIPKILTNKARIGLSIYDYSSCVVGEVNYLKNHDIYFIDNYKKAQTKCGVQTGYKLVRSELTLAQYFGMNILNTGVDELFTRSYYQKPQEHNFIKQALLDIDFKIYNNISVPLFEGISTMFEPISNKFDYYIDKSIDFAVDYTIEQVNNITEGFNSLVNDFTNEIPRETTMSLELEKDIYDLNNYAFEEEKIFLETMLLNHYKMN